MARRDGLTLMEVVVALVVVSVLMAALYASFRVAWIGQRSGTQAVHRLQGAGEAVRLLRTDLMGVTQPGTALGGRLIAEPAGDGWVSHLQLRSNGGMVKVDYAGLTTSDLGSGLSSRWPIQPIGADVQEVTWSVRSDSSTGRSMLVRSTTRNVLALQEPYRDERVILRDVLGMRLRYYNGQEWRREWDSELEGQRLPIAVEVTIELAEGEGAAGYATASGRPVTTLVTLPMSQMSDEMGGLRR